MMTLRQFSAEPSTIPTITYREFENRVDQMKSPRGAKTEQVEAAVKAFSGTFTLYELECACMLAGIWLEKC